MYINNLGHMTKMATMPIYGKNPSKIFVSKTNRQISMKLSVTLTQFMARSTWVAHAFVWEKLLKCHLKGKASRK